MFKKVLLEIALDEHASCHLHNGYKCVDRDRDRKERRERLAIQNLDAHPIIWTFKWLSSCVPPCTGQVVVEEDDEDDATAEAVQIDRLREAGE